MPLVHLQYWRVRSLSLFPHLSRRRRFPISSECCLASSVLPISHPRCFFSCTAAVVVVVVVAVVLVVAAVVVVVVAAVAVLLFDPSLCCCW